MSDGRIAKNTLFLYCRMLLVMGVSLFTTRVLLETLGVEDFGIFNVVGGVVLMFSFLSATMSSATQRFFAVELGRNDKTRLNDFFCVTMLIYAGISVITIICAETVGLWFVNTQMMIPSERLSAANWVYQFSVFSLVFTMMMIPYHAAVIAQEDMNVFAVVSVGEAILKLTIVYLLMFFDVDKLKLYGLLIFITTCLAQVAYYVYCRIHYDSYVFRIYWNKKMFYEMLVFSGWNMIGTIGQILRSQGINILLNMFFNPTVNAARAIAYQVNSAVTNFTNNFYTAVRPQIFKKYASGNIQDMHGLVIRSSRYAYLLMLILIVPLFCETESLFSIWLKRVPNYSILFTRLVLISALLEVFSFPLVSAIQASGNIKFYQITVSVIYLCNVPLSFCLLKNNFPPESTMYVNIGLVIFSFIPRLYICKKIVNFPIMRFVQDVLVKVLLCTVVNGALLYLLKENIHAKLFVLLSFEIMISVLIVLFIGISKKERLRFLMFIRSKIHL